MMMDRKQRKQQARQAMGQARPAPILVALVLVIFTLVISTLIMSLNGTLAGYRQIMDDVMAGLAPTVPETEGWTGGPIGWLLGVALEIMSMELSVGFVIYCMLVWRRQKAGVGNLFDGFGVFFRCIWISMLPSIFLSFWSMVYVAPVTAMVVLTGNDWWLIWGLPLLLPMVMASYSYRLSAYIMLDNPHMSCFACIAMSRAVMRSRRWKLFVQDLSFLGWALLCLIPLAGIVAMLWLNAYTGVTMAGFYEQAVAEHMGQTAPPVEQPPFQA